MAAEHYGTLAETRRYAAVVARVMGNPDMVQLIQERGLASADEIEAVRAGVVAWGERPDAFAAVMYCAALGWVDSE